MRDMKRCISVVLMWMAWSQVTLAQNTDPVLFTMKSLGDEYIEEVTKSEFEYIYRKNNSNLATEKKSLDEYLQLFVDFKLKVLDAKLMWIDRSESYKRELSTYEAQLTLPYLRDTLKEEELAREAYDRDAYDVSASHILVALDENATDTAKAFAKINDVYNQLKNGASFREMAQKYSDCPSKRDGGSLGIVRPFTTVYPFENAVYNTAVGAISKPFRTKFGYHIVNVTKKAPHYSDVRFSQIVLDDSVAAKNDFANKLCEQLNAKKVKFADAVKKYSIDSLTRVKDGDAGWLSSMPYIPPFYANQLCQIGEKGKYVVLKSFVTTNIVVLTDMVGNKPYDEVKKEYRARVAKGDRGELSVDNVVEKMKRDYGVKVFPEGVEPFYRMVEMKSNDDIHNEYRKLSEPLYSFDGNVYPQEDFLPVFKDERHQYKKSDTLSAKQFVDRSLDAFLKKKCWEKTKSDLKERNAEYRNLLKEYSDGLLLFEASSRKVWNKAAKDKEGLAKFFDENKSKYKWTAPKYKGVVIYCADKPTLTKVNKMLPKLDQDSVAIVLNREFNKDGKKLVKMERGLFQEGANAVVDCDIFKKEGVTLPSDGAFPFHTLKGKLLTAPESYMDVKGPLTADYQNYLERKWVEELRERHEVHIFNNVLNMIHE